MIRFGIVGAAGIARKFARDLTFVKNASLTAVSARSEEKAKLYQKEYGCEHAFQSYEAMAKSDTIDAVYIATPHKFHKEQAMLFLKHHKHVLVEKPASVNAKEFEEMAAYALTQNLLLMEAMWTHFLPAIRVLVDDIKKGTYGKLLNATLKFGFPIAQFKDNDSRYLDPQLAGGSLLDLGIYPVSFVSLLQQSPFKSVQATSTFTKTGVDKTGTIKLVEKNGATYTLKHSMSRLTGDKAKLTFEHATIVIPGFHGAQSLKINGKTLSIPYEGEGFVHEIRAFVENLLNQSFENDIMSYDKTLKTMILMDQIRAEINLKYPFE